MNSKMVSALSEYSQETQSVLLPFLRNITSEPVRRMPSRNTSVVTINHGGHVKRAWQVVIRLCEKDADLLAKWGIVNNDMRIAVCPLSDTGEFLLAREGAFPGLQPVKVSRPKNTSTSTVSASRNVKIEQLRKVYGFDFGGAEVYLEPICDHGRIVAVIVKPNGETFSRDGIKEG